MKKVQLAVCFALLLVICGCGKDSAQREKPKETLPPITGSGAVQGQGNSGQTPVAQISEEEAEAFAASWRNAIQQGDVGKANELVDWDGIWDRALEGFNLNAQTRNEMKQANSGATSVGTQLTGQLHQNISGGGTYHLLRVVSRSDGMHVVFRLLNPDQGVNYHDFRLNRIRGKVVADRFHVAATGEEMADTLHTNLAPVVRSQASMMGRISGEAKEKLDELKLKDEFLKAAVRGDLQLANQKFGMLSDEDKKSKVVMLAMLKIAAQTDEGNYLSWIDRFARQFPDDPSLGLMTLDAAVLRGDMKQLEQCRQIIHDWTGGDSYLDAMVAVCLLQNDDLPRAQEIVADIPPESIDLAQTHGLLLDVALANEDNEAVLKHLMILESDFDFEFEDLRTVDEYKGFVQSPQFEQWQAR